MALSPLTPEEPGISPGQWLFKLGPPGQGPHGKRRLPTQGKPVEGALNSFWEFQQTLTEEGEEGLRQEWLGRVAGEPPGLRSH